jgi:hypothetical protein
MRMNKPAACMSDSIALPPARLCIAITGHRESNAAFAANRAGIEGTLASVFGAADAVTARQSDAVGVTRLLSLLAHGADLIAVDQALSRGWEIVAPLPFGLDLNIAINADPENAADAGALLAKQPVSDSALAKRAAHIRDVASHARLFELAEEDAKVSRLFVDMLRAPEDALAARAFANGASDKVATAGRVMIEQSDLLVAIWDGVTSGGIGGTRHTISTAVNLGTPVIWINAAHPEILAILHTPEELFVLSVATGTTTLGDIEKLLETTLNPPAADQNERAIRFHTEQWHPRSHRRFHAYRRIESLFGGKGLRGRFGGLVQRYETPDAIATGTGAAMLAQAYALPAGDMDFIKQVEADVLQRFAWADGLSTYLSDAYRGGMVTNFLLSALAIIVGVAYLPFASVDTKWPFALAELMLLGSILAITATGRRRRWHGRWFETRRVAEYFRHAPIMLLLGVARASGRWPRGAETEWPEYYAREALREIGLPSVVVSQGYLRDVLDNLLREHASRQRQYHEAKAQRLTRVHHGLDRISERLFIFAVVSVATYLSLMSFGALGVIPAHWAHDMSKTFTFLGVILPALGGAFAGIRYFGDFERFAAISEVTAEKLEEVEERINILLKAPDGELRYAQIADLAHAIDDIVVTEIENWQSVFGSKQIAVPV